MVQSNLTVVVESGTHSVTVNMTETQIQLCVICVADSNKE